MSSGLPLPDGSPLLFAFPFAAFLIASLPLLPLGLLLKYLCFPLLSRPSTLYRVLRFPLPWSPSCLTWRFAPLACTDPLADDLSRLLLLWSLWVPTRSNCVGYLVLQFGFSLRPLLCLRRLVSCVVLGYTWFQFQASSYLTTYGIIKCI